MANAPKDPASKENETPAAGGPSAPPSPYAAPAAPTEEQRIAAQRWRELEDQASKSASGMQQAKSDLAAAQGELDRAKEANLALTEENARLKTENAALAAGAKRGDLPALAVDLPKGAFQLLDSVTIASIGEAGNPVRTSARHGDVVYVLASPKAVEKLQREIGQVARVYAIDDDTADELHELKHIR